MPLSSTSCYVQDRWGDVIAQLPADLEALGAEHGVLKYRRAITRVSDLIRLAVGPCSLLSFGARSTRARAPETPDTTPPPPQAEAASSGT